jgi:hypothetical protein
MRKALGSLAISACFGVSCGHPPNDNFFLPTTGGGSGGGSSAASSASATTGSSMSGSTSAATGRMTTSSGAGGAPTTGGAGGAGGDPSTAGSGGSDSGAGGTTAGGGGAGAGGAGAGGTAAGGTSVDDAGGVGGRPDAGAIDAGAGNGSTRRIRCGSTTCAALAQFCCLPVGLAARCEPVVGGDCPANGDRLYCDDRTDCAVSNQVCCAADLPSTSAQAECRLANACNGAKAQRLCDPLDGASCDMGPPTKCRADDRSTIDGYTYCH